MKADTTQGALANDAGKRFEDDIARHLVRLGARQLTLPERVALVDGAALRSIAAPWFTRQLKAFRSLYEKPFQADFVFFLRDCDGPVLVEAKFQTAGGSVDEKFPFAVGTLKRAAAEHDLTACLVLGGGGACAASRDWCGRQTTTAFRVIPSIEALHAWGRAGFKL